MLKSQKYEISVLYFLHLCLNPPYRFFIYGFATLFGFHIDLVYCILFGALISPTDPIAVLAIIKNLKAPKSWRSKWEGESLFNGVGLVISLLFSRLPLVVANLLSVIAAKIFFIEAIGGIIFGAILGLIAHYLISATDDGSLEILLTLTVRNCRFYARQYVTSRAPWLWWLPGSWSETGPDKAGFPNKVNAT